MPLPIKLPEFHAPEPPSVVAFIKSGEADKAYRLAQLHAWRGYAFYALALIALVVAVVK